MSNLTSNPMLDEKELRKAWLKQKFGSFEYHEEMLQLHRQWLDVLRRALARAENDDTPLPPHSGYNTVGEEAQHFRKRFMPLIECNDDLGKYRKDEWHRYHATATFRSIPDYSRYLSSEGDMLSWMTGDEHAELGKYWAPMAQMAENIRYAVDGNWDAHPEEPFWILDEEYTGPITWPADWREDVLGKAGAGLLGLNTPRVRAGDPVPQAGQWRALDGSAQVCRAAAGDTLPDLKSAYGITVWQWIDD